MPFAQAADARIFYTRTGTGPAVLLLQGAWHHLPPCLW